MRVCVCECCVGGVCAGGVCVSGVQGECKCCAGEVLCRGSVSTDELYAACVGGAYVVFCTAVFGVGAVQS
jgi:hypothetical protein